MALVNCPECGKEVSESAVSCPNCGYGVAQHFNEIKKEMLKEHLQLEFAEKKEKLAKKLKIIIPCAVVVVGVAMGFVINSAVLSRRMTFETEDQMYNYLSEWSTWGCDDSRYLVFNKTGLVERIFVYSKMSFGNSDIELSPSRGKFKFNGNTYIISNNGNIISDNGDEFSQTTISSKAEIPSQVLKISGNDASITNNTSTMEYTATNTGKLTYSYIKLETTLHLKDGSDVILDDYATIKNGDSYELAPGESGTASLTSHDIPDNVDSFSSRIESYMTSLSDTD